MLEMKENENQPRLKNFILNLILTCNMNIQSTPDNSNLQGK